MTLNEILALHAEKRLVGAFQIPNHVYHAAPGLSKSSLDHLLVSPAFYQWKLKNPDNFKKELIIGSAFHAKVLEPHTLEDLFYITKTQPIKPEEDEQGRLPLSQANLDMVTAMAQKLSEHPKKMLLEGIKEMSFFWTDEATGILCKCKPDVLTGFGQIVDLKSTRSISKRAFSNSLHQHKYQMQAAFCIDGVKNAFEQSGQKFSGVLPDGFILFAQEKEEPYRAKAYSVGPNSLVQGEELYRKALELYAKCATTGIWPDNTEDIEEIESPIYTFQQGVDHE